MQANQHLLATLAVVPLLLAQASAAQSSAWLTTEEAKLLPGLPKHGAHFGGWVAVSGTTALIGAADDDNANGDDQAGSAYVFVRGDAGWSQTQRLEPADGDFYDRFGWSVAVSGNTAVIGSLEDDHQGFNAGSAYVFVRRGGVWIEQAKLVASDGVAYQRFAWSVAVSRDTAVVGAPGPGYTGPGAAYVFARRGTSWIEQQKLVPGDSTIPYELGHSVAISGDTIIIGTSYPGGAAYVFVRHGTTWIQQQELTGSSNSFGRSVALWGNTAVVGMPGGGPGGIYKDGAATVFVRNGAIWSKEQTLVASDPSLAFGHSVAVMGDMIVCGAIGGYPVGSGNENGSAYVFVRSGTTWTEQHKLVASDGTLDDNFGCSVGLSLDAIVVGAVGDDPALYNSGAAYAFRTPLVGDQ